MFSVGRAGADKWVPPLADGGSQRTMHVLRYARWVLPNLYALKDRREPGAVVPLFLGIAGRFSRRCMKQSSLSREREKVDMVQEETDAAANQERLARHQAFAEVLEGKRPMTWTDWALPFEDSRCLTPAGLHVAQWAVSVLERTFGSDFLQRAVPRAHPVFSMGFWPGLNDVAWVYANIFQLAAQIEILTRAESHDVHLVLLEMSQDLQESRWIHSLLQLELASLGLQTGWSSQFEPKLSTLNSADLCLTRILSTWLLA